MKTQFKQWLLAATAAALLTGCNAPTQPETSASTQAVKESLQTDTRRLLDWFQANFEEDLAASPEQQTYLGLIDDMDAYGRWNDPSEAYFRKEMAKEAKRLAFMRKSFDLDALTPKAQLSFRFAEFITENNARQAEFWDHNYVFTQFFGPHTDMSTTLIGYHKVENVDHAEAYIRRLESYGDVLNTHTAEADKRAKAGVLPPKFAFPIIIRTAGGIVEGAPFDADAKKDSPLLADFTKKVTDLKLEKAQQQALIARATKALETSVGPAYKRLIATMEAHQALTGEHDGAWKLPRGEAYYQTQLANYTTRDDLSADQIHQTGLSEVARIHDEMRQIMAKVKFTGTLKEFFAHLRESDQFYLADTEAGRQQYLQEATAAIDGIMEIAPKFFGNLPKASLEVRAVEPYRIETATGAFYEPGSLDGSRPGAYYVNLSNMRELPFYQMETLAYHEGAPGHHFQSSISQELEDAPMFQKLTWYSAYGEGWALYSENLGKDMGGFTDPYQDFGRLSYEVFRAARLVVDTGIHSKKWTEKQAADYMLATTPMTTGDIENEIRRYIVWPGQAVSYKTGMLTILELRKRALDTLGDKFDWGEFHDVVLNSGSIPLTLLSEQVDGYIAQKSAAM